jgi:hypothetical protein
MGVVAVLGVDARVKHSFFAGGGGGGVALSRCAPGPETGVSLVFCGCARRFGRERVRADQRLRVRGEGDSMLTNPNIQMRRRYVGDTVSVTPAPGWWWGDEVIVSFSCGLTCVFRARAAHI